MTRTHLTFALAAVAGLATLGAVPAFAAPAIDPAPATASALPAGSFQVAGLRFLNGKWIDDLGNVVDDFGSALRKVEPTQPNAIGKVPDRPLPKLPDEPPPGYGRVDQPPPGYGRVDEPPPDATAMPRYEAPGSKLGDEFDNGAGIANDLPNVPTDAPHIAPPRTPPGSFRGDMTAVARVSPLPPRAANVRRAAEVAAEEIPQQAPSFWKRNRGKIIGGSLFVGATGILIATPLVVDKLDRDGVFDGGNAGSTNGDNGNNGNNDINQGDGEQRFD